MRYELKHLGDNLAPKPSTCIVSLILKGVGPWCPPRHFARLPCNAQSSRRDTLWQFFPRISSIFWYQMCEAWGYGSEATQLFVHARQTENGSKFWFCVQNQCKYIFFSHLVHINTLIFTLNGWNSFVLALMCFKRCLPHISPKKSTKTTGQ